MSHAISWQSAFWALTALAVNTAIQDGGSVLGLPSEHCLALRSSPLVCLVDTTDIIARICLRLRTQSFVQSVRGVAELKQVKSRSEEDHSVWKRAIEVVTGILALLQAIKLFACQGIPWVQTFGAIYLASYLVQGLLNYLCVERSTNYPVTPQQPIILAPNEANVVEAERLVCLTSQLMCWIWLLFRATPSHSNQDELFTSTAAFLLAGLFLLLFQSLVAVPGMILILTACLLFALVVVVLPPCLFLYYTPMVMERLFAANPVNLVADALDVQEETLTWTASPSIVLAFIWLEFRYLPWLWDLQAVFEGILSFPPLKWAATLILQDESFPFWYDVSEAIVLLLLTFFICFLLFRLGFRGRLARAYGWYHGDKKAWLYAYLVMANLMTALVYFSCTYASQGTFKPAWTENLG